ncbi:hypothetical protein N7528_004444 [Penicillium herquei]|nr:hypothetical protein N7528_004444 [Penicillium herquei]
MPITELACLRLKATEPSSTKKDQLKQAQKAQSEYSGYPARFFREVEDPAICYIVGGWESVTVHTEEWIVSETNQKNLGVLKDDVDIAWMFHLDIDLSTSPIPVDAPVIAVSRFFVEPAKKDAFDTVFKAGVPYFGAHTAPFTYSGGWRIDKEGEDEEFVLFSGWGTVEAHFAFADTEAFKEFGKLRELKLFKDAEIKHMRLEEWK